ncbi:MAG: ATP-binding protein [Microbacteriaceae bacterium]|nr:ATP-binding protein [Microbacteriaceae bacterium]MDR9444224.1 ATP-binding protein [Microbacteriaceae bacterium]
MLPESGDIVNKVNTIEQIALGLLIAFLVLGLVAGIAAIRRSRYKSSSGVNVFEEVAAEIVDRIANAGVVLNRNNQVLRYSPGAQVFGLIQNRHLIHASLVNLVDEARDQQDVIERDVEIESGSGKNPIWLRARAAHFGRDLVILLVDDRTESKRLEETRRDFVANVSHELKTPIGAISLLAEAIEDSIDDPETAKRFAQNLSKESKRLSNLVQEVIQLSKMQSGPVLENAIEMDLRQVVTDAVERNQTLAEQQGIKVMADTHESIHVKGDYDMLTAALRNLIENAIVYSDNGAQVGVGIKRVGDLAEISVADSGRGISEDEQERIFERFYRVDPSRSRETGGTGLGLSIVKHAAQNHNGEVKLFSRLGVGSTFTLRIPTIDKQIGADA